MRYKILSNGQEINTIEADFLFVSAYCQSAGYTFEEALLPTPTSESTPTDAERITALEAENKLLKAQVQAQSESHDFLEDCVVEMASIIYAE